MNTNKVIAKPSLKKCQTCAFIFFCSHFICEMRIYTFDNSSLNRLQLKTSIPFPYTLAQRLLVETNHIKVVFLLYSRAKQRIGFNLC